MSEITLISHCATDGDEIQPSVRERVLELEAVMRAKPQVTVQTIHHFVPGLYAREIVIPKGVLATSKIHLYEHLSIVAKGDINVLMSDGTAKRIIGPAVFISAPGDKLLGYANEDTVWISIERCEAREPEQAERELVVETHEEFVARLPEGNKCHLLPRR